MKEGMKERRRTHFEMYTRTKEGGRNEGMMNAFKTTGARPTCVCLSVCMLPQVDPSVSFDQVGGLSHYIKALKEMVFLPLVYPELFERFHLSPPRGVLFYGPPGVQPLHQLCCLPMQEP